ncbi:MAG: carbohydrate kinase family protein [Candidatus Limnocylindrales bacterium]
MTAPSTPRRAPRLPLRLESARRRVGRPDRPSIVTLGDLALDVAAATATRLAPASDTPGTVRFRQGGSAANTARWAARAGGRAIFIGAIGRDAWGRRLLASLRSAGVTVHAPRVAAPTARIVALVEPGGERSFVTERGAADGLQAASIRPAWLRSAAVLHVPAYSLLREPLAGATRHAAALARGWGAAVSVDLASRQPLLALGRDEAWHRVATLAPDLLFANLAEAGALLDGSGHPSAAALLRLLDLAPLVVLKEGGAGCRVLARHQGAGGAPASLDLAIATRPLHPADTTGAGDAFDAGFLVAWAGAPVARRADAGTLRRAAMAGHRTATRLLSEPRQELAL